MKHDVAGDPITGVKWTRRTTEKIAEELAALGVHVCANTVARLLKQLDYALRVNHKRVARGCGPDRNEQFEYIAEQRRSFARRNLPIVSIDTKKKELIGNFKNAGTAWDQTPQLVRDHDFRSDAEGIAIPYGIYDVSANRGTVFVGISHDTAEFAADNLVDWWQSEGRERYPGATEILVLADGGGSNAPRCSAFHLALQERLADLYGLRVTVCHYPAGAAKWNPIEHRLFSEISKNWAGCPLRTYQIMLNYIRTTRTATGLRVSAHLIELEYPTGVKLSKARRATINITRHDVQPVRNYTIVPHS
ncbi:MAG: ISAzo13 family transposase [Longimicrobiales bacterium]